MGGLVFCGCKSCRAGLHKSRGKAAAKKAGRRLRHGAKVAILKGREAPTVSAVGYTDCEAGLNYIASAPRTTPCPRGWDMIES